MARIIVTEFISLDGVSEAPGGDDNFVHGAWTFAFERGDAGNDFKTVETTESDALFLGRRTYEGFSQAWPQYEGEFADRFNTMPKYVVSSTLADASWGPTTVLPDLPAALERIDAEVGGYVIVHGSLQLAQALLAAGRVDELRLMEFPVLLGTGKRLWPEDGQMRKWTLQESRPVGDDGVTVKVYVPQEG